MDSYVTVSNGPSSSVIEGTTNEQPMYCLQEFENNK